MDTAVATIVVAGVIQITTLIIGFLTVWLKTREVGTKAEEAADKAGVVEDKLDDNTRTTNQVDQKADTLVAQTNGVVGTLQRSVDQLLNRVGKLEDYNRESAHRILDAVNNMNLRLAEFIGRTAPGEKIEKGKEL